MQRFGFFLVPGFSMLSLAAALEPLRMANAQAGDELYQWEFL
ncbi:MAG: GlxA family transcriptional regulator, partial [Oceanospirillaceae bacterium]|nr:GlxA family transcriptional regulator [Oceanospirillaceae bacterium]